MAQAAVCADAERRSVVVVPSRTVDRWYEPPAETQAYEERLLSFLFELRDPRLQMTYVTSLPIAAPTIDYYISLMPPAIRLSARERLTLVSLADRSPRPLSEKLLDRPSVLEQIRCTIREPSLSYLLPYNATALERDLALALDIPMYGPNPVHAGFGTKSGSRKLFGLSGVPHPIGTQAIRTVSDAVRAICMLRASRPALNELIVKLDQGVSGEGNAIVDLTGLPEPGARDERRLIESRVVMLAPQIHGVTAADYLWKLARQGGIAEERIAGFDLRSPSVQLEIRPAGQVEVLSTHDQLLGGTSGQRYLGCRFPADRSYAPLISGLATRVGDYLAGVGVIGRLAIDFVVVRKPDHRWEAFAVEVNLRLGGTTHPYQTLARLTGGLYDVQRAIFITPAGQHRHYVSSDHLETPLLSALGRDGLLALVRRGQLRFDRREQLGVVFHMLASVDELSRVGATAIADTAEHANMIFDRVRTTLTMPGAADRRALVHERPHATL